MRLRVMLPSEILVDREVSKVVAEGENGSFCLLPRHMDFVSALAPGILAFVSDESGGGEEREEFVAVDEGVLVKCGDEVLVSVRNAAAGAGLGELRKTVREKFAVLDERQKAARSAVAGLEAGFVRRFIELRERSGG